jgi:hypothetical protein
MAVSPFSRSTLAGISPRSRSLDTASRNVSLVDPNWSRVALLVQNGDFSNISPSGIGIEVLSGSASGLSSTAQVLEGSTKSLQIGSSGANKHIRYFNNALWNDFSQGFTYELYAYWTSFGGSYFVSRWNNNAGGLYQMNFVTQTNGLVTWTFRQNNTTTDIFNLNFGTLSTGQWYHLAGVIDGTQGSGTARVFVNGVQTNSISYSSPGLQTNSQTDMSLGYKQDGGATGTYDGTVYLDRIRFTAKTRYTSNFTPPYGLLPSRGQ